MLSECYPCRAQMLIFVFKLENHAEPYCGGEDIYGDFINGV